MMRRLILTLVSLLLGLLLVVMMPSLGQGAASNFGTVLEDDANPHTTGEMWIDACADFWGATGTWTCTPGGVGSGVYHFLRLTAVNGERGIHLAVRIPSQSASGKGYRITSITFYYRWDVLNTTNGIHIVLREATLPANGSLITSTEKAMTSDLTYNQRIAADEMTNIWTVTSPTWSSTGTIYKIQFQAEGDGTALLDLFGAKVNYTYNWH